MDLKWEIRLLVRPPVSLLQRSTDGRGMSYNFHIKTTHSAGYSPKTCLVFVTFVSWKVLNGLKLIEFFFLR